jgi:hypothetical protein
MVVSKAGEGYDVREPETQIEIPPQEDSGEHFDSKALAL